MSDTALPVIFRFDTTANRMAFTPSPGASEQLYLWEDSDNQPDLYYWDGAAWQLINAASTGDVTHTGTLTANALIIGNGTNDIKVTTTGTGILTALGINVGNAGAPVTFNGALGTPSSGVGTNLTGYLAANLTNISSIYINLQDQKAQNTSGGTFTSGAWETRTLNTEVSDIGGLCSLASNQFTLSAGTYIIAAIAPAFGVDRHQLRIQNVTDATTVLTGQVCFSANSAGSPINQDIAQLRGIFTVAASKALELQHQGQTTVNTNGFGIPCNFTTEVYAIVELWKIG